MELKFEWFVAWRHLYERHPRAGRLAHIFSAFAFTVAAIALGLMLKTKPLGPVQIIAGHRDWRQIFHIIVVVALELAVLTLVFGWFRRRLSMFSTISAYGVFLGTMALVIVLSVMNGFEGDLRRKILGSNAHVLVTKEDGAFTEWREVDKKLAGIPGILGYAPYVQSEVGVSANSNYAGAIIKGIDPSSVGRVTDLRANVESDEMLARLWPLREDGTPEPYENHGFAEPDAAPEPPDAAPGTPDAEEAEEEPPEVFDTPASLPTPASQPTSQPTSQPIVTTIRPRGSDPRTDPLDGMLLGAEMYRNLHLFPGQEVQVVSPLLQDTPGGQVPRTRRFRVAGKVVSGMYEYDTRNVYVTMPALQRFLSLGDEITGFEVKLADLDATGVAIDRIQRALGPGYVVRDWKDLNRSLFSALKLEKIAMFLVLTIIILVASFSIVANLIMLVVEKAREIAILKSMGAADAGIQWIFMLEGVYLGALGTGFGILKGVGTCVFLQTFGLPLNSNVYYINSLPVEMDVLAIVFVSLAGLAISFIATIYPARVAARLRPVEGLRRD